MCAPISVGIVRIKKGHEEQIRYPISITPGSVAEEIQVVPRPDSDGKRTRNEPEGATMSRSKKRQKKGRAKTKKTTPQSGQARSSAPTFVRHPLSDIPPDVLRSHATQYARKSEVVFEESLAEIQKVLREVDPLSLVSQLSMYGLSGGVSEDGKISAWNSDKGFGQANVELVQALSLQLAPEELVSEFVTPDVVQRCFDNLPKLSEAFAARRMVALDQERSEPQKSVSLLQEHLRLHTQTVRNWGYADKVMRILGCLATYFDVQFVDQLGVSATQILKIFQHLMELSERNGNTRFRKLKQVFEHKTIEGMVRTYNELFICAREGEAEFIEDLKGEGVPIKQLKFMLMTHSDLRLREVYTFTSAEVAEDLKIPAEAVKCVLDDISLSFGGLSDRQPDSLLLDNPVWIKPVVRLGGDKYFCALPMALFGFAFHILNDIVTRNPKLKDAYHDGKSKFLEAEITRLFRDAFPGCRIGPSYKWADGDKQFENDLLVSIDSHLFIVEAKSHSISWPALRGAPDRARRHIRETILDPSEQSWRLADRLRQVLGSRELQEQLLPHFPLPLDGVHTVLRLSVTLEDFAVVQTNHRLFEGTGWIPEEHRLAPCILLADLEVVFDILDSIAQRIHYLRRRAELVEKNIDIVGDEIDFVGFYLETGFNIGLTEFGKEDLVLTEMSGTVDEYCMARAEGIARKKPALRLTGWWRAILQAIEKRRFDGWTDMVCILLSCSYEDQQNAETMFADLRRSVHRTYTDPKHLSSVIIMPHEHRADALAFYAFKEVEKDRRRDVMHDLSFQAFEQEHIQRCLVIGVNIDRPVQPYSTLICFFRNDPTTRSDFDVR